MCSCALLCMTSSTTYVFSDETCFVPVGRVYLCGTGGESESECEAMGCCYNSSAVTQCYYPSGEYSVVVRIVVVVVVFVIHIVVVVVVVVRVVVVVNALVSIEIHVSVLCHYRC